MPGRAGRCVAPGAIVVMMSPRLAAADMAPGWLVTSGEFGSAVGY